MRIRHLFALMTTTHLVFGCGGKADTGEGSDTDSDSDTDAVTDTDESNQSVEKNAYLNGIVVWADGSAAEGLQMRLCHSSCYVASSDADGVYEFPGVEASAYTLQAVVTGDETYGTPTTPITLEADTTRELGAWVVPQFTTSETITGASEVELEGGLTVTADPDAVSRGTYSVSDEASVWSVRVEPDEAGILLEGIEGTVVGLWYLGNYDLQLEPAWSLGGVLELGLDAGTELQVWTASNADKGWSDNGVVTVGENGTLTQSEGVGLSQLTTLLLVQE